MKILKIQFKDNLIADSALKELSIVCGKLRRFDSAIVVLQTMHNLKQIDDVISDFNADVTEPTTSDRWLLLNSG